MKTISAITAASLLAMLASHASAQSISKQGFNFSPPPCPGKSNGATTNVNTFSDRTPLPSCGGREQSGNVIKTYELVWTGHAWAEYLPSVKTTTLTAPLVAPSGPSLPAHAATPVISSSLVPTLPEGSLNGRNVYLYNGNWVSLIASGGGNMAAQLIASGGGNLIASGGGNLIATGGGNYSLQSVGGSANAVHTSAGTITLNATNLAKYKQATGAR